MPHLILGSNIPEKGHRLVSPSKQEISADLAPGRRAATNRYPRNSRSLDRSL